MKELPLDGQSCPRGSPGGRFRVVLKTIGDLVTDGIFSKLPFRVTVPYSEPTCIRRGPSGPHSRWSLENHKRLTSIGKHTKSHRFSPALPLGRRSKWQGAGKLVKVTRALSNSCRIPTKILPDNIWNRLKRYFPIYGCISFPFVLPCLGSG